MNKHQEICKIVIIYVLFGCAWIYFSDTALGWFVRDPEIMTKLAIFKGLLFIITTSVLLYFLIARLSTKINQSINALRESEERLHFLVKNSSDSLVILNADGSQRYVSPAAEQITGYPVAELEGRALDTLIHPDDMQAITAAWNEAIEHPEKTVTVQYRHIHKTREWIFSEAIAQSFLHEPAINGVIASVRDITERKKAEEEKDKLQTQLTQSQKMESVGRLAGGMAHDFNNMLTVILGYTEMALDRVDHTQPLFANLQDIRKAAERSADLTQQLLAFARKQTVAPKVLDLNQVVEGMLKMLRPLIGEDIDLAWLPGKNLGLVKMDPSQVDQILANLCVNARDAIGDTGKVTIETDTVRLDTVYGMTHTDFLPGEYVLLAVSDNGCGMDAETRSHLFEPFFTTKATGKGTGLGLATVYGIVKQNNGVINVYSEPGQGATFKVYLPRHAAESDQVPWAGVAKPDARGYETILLVEDEPMILEMTALILKQQGYAVLTAATPGEAMQLAREHTGTISLLMTDVVMPEMNGRTLAKHLLAFDPDLKCLFMSGYTANVIAHHGVLDQGVHFIQKPFTVKDLAAKVREVLD
jgi:PAS domain S-box-containing protein